MVTYPWKEWMESSRYLKDMRDTIAFKKRNVWSSLDISQIEIFNDQIHFLYLFK